MLAYHNRTSAKVTVSSLQVPLSDARECGVIRVDEKLRIVDFAEKTEQPCSMPHNREIAMVSMGVYVFDTDCILDLLDEDAKLETSNHDFGRDIVPAAIRERAVYAFSFTDLDDVDKPGYWRDVGTVDSYWKGNIELTDATPELESLRSELADIDLPATAFARKVRVQRTVQLRQRHGFTGQWWLHRLGRIGVSQHPVLGRTH